VEGTLAHDPGSAAQTLVLCVLYWKKYEVATLVGAWRSCSSEGASCGATVASNVTLEEETSEADSLRNPGPGVVKR
jgi:hypothetical protein